MYLQELRISNFRCFSEPQTIEFSKGINVSDRSQRLFSSL